MKQELQAHLISIEIVEAIEKLAEQDGKEVIDLATELLKIGLNQISQPCKCKSTNG